MNDGLAHGLEDGLCSSEGGFAAADHEGERGGGSTGNAS